MKIKEGLIFDKYNDQLVCRVCNIRQCLQLAYGPGKEMLVFSIGSHHCNSHACTYGAWCHHSFVLPVCTVSNWWYHCISAVSFGDSAILQLEMLGFKVICMTCNDALLNCKLCKISSSNLTSNDSGVPYKMLNSYTDENRDLYLISDVPHLLKTTRNCWANSYAHSCSRHVWVSVCVCVCVLCVLWLCFYFG